MVECTKCNEPIECREQFVKLHEVREYERPWPFNGSYKVSEHIGFAHPRCLSE